MLNIKKIILIIIDFIKKFFFLSNLSENELRGFISLLTQFRFFPFSRVNVPFSLGRTIRGVSFDDKLPLDPYAILCKDIANGVDTKIIFNNLLKELNKEKKLNAAEIIHLNNNKNLSKYPVWAIVMPWEKISIEEKFQSYPDIFFSNRHSNGLNFKNNMRQTIINTMHSSECLNNKIDQMEKLFKSIKKNYVIQNFNLPKIDILVRDNEWRWIMGDGGNHRSYILSSIKHEFFSARVGTFIRKTNVSNWPNVKNGTYSVNEAEHIFDSYFNGSNVLRGII